MITPPNRTARWMLWGLKNGIPGWEFIPKTKIDISRNLHKELCQIVGFSPQALSFYIGSPGAYRKAIFFISNSGGERQAVLKLSLLPGANLSIEKEAQTLKKLNSLTTISGFVPELINTGQIQGQSHLLMTPLAGSFGGYHLQSWHWLFLKRLWQAEKKTYCWQESPFREKNYEQISLLSKTNHFPTLQSALSLLDENLFDQQLSFGWAHRDFTPWNIQIEKREPRVLDWEISTNCAPPGYDLFHFCAIQKALKRQELKSLPPNFSEWIDEVAPEWHSRESLLYLAYLLDQAIFYSLARLDKPEIGNDKVLHWLLCALDKNIAKINQKIF